MLLALQAMRGLAAVLVVLHHTAVNLAAPHYMRLVIMGGIFAPLGRAGVDLFFVLSGFIIYYVHHGDIGKPDRVASYLARRLVRIYPTYWAVLLVLVAVLFAVPSLGGAEARQFDYIMRSALLIPFTQPGQFTLLGVAWTLSHELLFYGLFALCIVNRRFGVAAFAVWLACLLVARLPSTLPPPLNFFLHVKNLEFFIGLATARLVMAGGWRSGWAVFLCGAAAFAATGIVECQGFDFQVSTPTLCYGLTAGIMIFALASLERRGLIPAVPRPLLWLGAASYSIYLIHVLIVIGLVKAAHAYGLTGYALFLLIPIFAVSGGVALHAGIERPVLARAGRRLAAPRTPAIMPRRAAPG